MKPYFLLLGCVAACASSARVPEKQPAVPLESTHSVAESPPVAETNDTPVVLQPAPSALPLPSPRAVPAQWPNPTPMQNRGARFHLIKQQKSPPVRTQTDPAPRVQVTRGLVPEWVREFEQQAPIATLAPAARDERWRVFLQRTVPAHLQHLVMRFFFDRAFDMLSRCEAQYGVMEHVEWFQTNAGPRFLLVFSRTTPAPAVSIFNEHRQYTAVAMTDPADHATLPGVLWALDLDALFPGVLELNDIQFGPEGALLFNTVYPSYAKEVNGKTAYLYAVDPESATVRWRSQALRSRSDFAIRGDLIVTGYGFTAEPDYLFAFDRASGAELGRLKLPTAHDRLRWLDDGLHVATYDADLVVDVIRAPLAAPTMRN